MNSISSSSLIQTELKTKHRKGQKMVRPGNYNYNAKHQKDNTGFLILAAILGMGFLFSTLALIVALLALCR